VRATQTGPVGETHPEELASVVLTHFFNRTLYAENTQIPSPPDPGGVYVASSGSTDGFEGSLRGREWVWKGDGGARRRERKEWEVFASGVILVFLTRFLTQT